MRVLINTRSTNHLEDDEESIPLSSLLAEADVISLHCPLTNKTKNLIGKKRTRPNEALINSN